MEKGLNKHNCEFHFYWDVKIEILLLFYNILELF